MQQNQDNPFADKLFKTNNQPLAFALATAGCSFAPQEKGGPAINMYSVECLRERRVGMGLPLEKAVELAVERKVLGNVTYIFERTEKLERCIKAWDMTTGELSEAEAAGRAPILPELNPADIMQTVCLAFNNRELMLKEVPWFNRPLIFNSTTQTETKGEKTIITGKGKIYSLGLNPTTKEQLRNK